MWALGEGIGLVALFERSEKVSNRVNWSFLDDMVCRFGFGLIRGDAITLEGLVDIPLLLKVALNVNIEVCYKWMYFLLIFLTLEIHEWHSYSLRG